MTGAMSKRAARASGGIVVRPTITQEQASAIMGHTIPDEAWQDIARAFHDYGWRQRALETSKASLSKGDDQSWHTRKDAATKAIEAAMKKVDAARSKHGDFLTEASENYCVETFGHSYLSQHNARRLLDQAFKDMLDALVILERSNPQEIETPTAATSRDMLIRDIHRALTSCDIEARASNGRDLGQLERVAINSLTAFEKLIAEMKIGDERKPAAFSKMIRAAIAGQKQG